LTNVVKAAIGAVAQVAQPVGQAPDP
jgi:hypothetical protein